MDALDRLYFVSLFLFIFVVIGLRFKIQNNLNIQSKESVRA